MLIIISFHETQLVIWHTFNFNDWIITSRHRNYEKTFRFQWQRDENSETTIKFPRTWRSFHLFCKARLVFLWRQARNLVRYSRQVPRNELPEVPLTESRRKSRNLTVSPSKQVANSYDDENTNAFMRSSSELYDARSNRSSTKLRPFESYSALQLQQDWFKV